MDVRDVARADLAGFDAVIHLAAISNDPVGDLDPSCTYAINHEASVRLAALARAAGVRRFLFSSSCSLYGAASKDQILTETASLNPVTAVWSLESSGGSRNRGAGNRSVLPHVSSERDGVRVLPRLRADIVVNNLVGLAFTTGKVTIMSDGTPWRPLVHVEDICRVFIAVIEAPTDRIHNQAFNVGVTTENYQIRDVAGMVEEIVPGSQVTYAEGAGPDLRCYRVDFSKLAAHVSRFRFEWTVRDGIEQLLDAYRRHDLTFEQFTGPRFVRLKRIKELLVEGALQADLRRTVPVGAVAQHRRQNNSSVSARATHKRRRR